MKQAEAIVVTVAFLSVFGAFVWGATRTLRGRRERRSIAEGAWRVEPRTLPSGDRQVFIVKPGHDDFLFATVRVDDYGKFHSEAWDEALYGAEEQAREFDRLTRPVEG